MLFQNYNIYRAIAEDTLKVESVGALQNYKIWANLRDMLYSVTQSMAKTSDRDTNEHRLFGRLLLIAHYNAMRCSCSASDQLNLIAAKLSISLLRHTDIIPADKAFYEAGIMCQVSALPFSFL